MTSTLAYYQDNAAAFIAGTVDVDMSALRGRFLANLPAAADILDAGCGSGRDSKAFRDLGYRVVAFDASEAMVRHATALTGLPVLCLSFQEVEFADAFDGIWASASLLHVRRNALPDALGRLRRALRPGGVLYMSFKLGDGEREIDGRAFTDLDEAGLAHLLAVVPGLTPVEVWQSADSRPERHQERWLNVLLCRDDG